MRRSQLQVTSRLTDAVRIDTVFIAANLDPTTCARNSPR
jgi:hypothetical protein